MTSAIADEEPLTVAQVARRRKVSPATVRAWIDRGELEATVESRAPDSKRPRHRVSEEALAAFLERRRVVKAVGVGRRRKLPPVPEYV
jgi:transposase